MGAGVIGQGIAVYAALKWYQQWRTRQIPEDTNGLLIFWRRGMLCGVLAVSALGSLVLLGIDLSGVNPQKILERCFLFYATHTLLGFVLSTFSLSGILSGIGGQIALSEGEEGQKPDETSSPSESTRDKIKDIMENPDDWDKIDERLDIKQPVGGKSIRELWRNRNTGKRLERHVLERKGGRIPHGHPHFKEPTGW